MSVMIDESDDKSSSSQSNEERPEIGFSFSPGGLLFPYHLGVIASLSDHGYITDKTPLAGSSAGAIAVALYASGVNPFDAINSCIRICEHCTQMGGARGRLLPLLESELKENLPTDAHKKINQRIGLTGLQYREIFPVPRSILATKFSARDDLIEAICNSSMFPFFTSNKPFLLRPSKQSAQTRDDASTVLVEEATTDKDNDERKNNKSEENGDIYNASSGSSVGEKEIANGNDDAISEVDRSPKPSCSEKQSASLANIRTKLFSRWRKLNSEPRQSDIEWTDGEKHEEGLNAEERPDVERDFDGYDSTELSGTTNTVEATQTNFSDAMEKSQEKCLEYSDESNCKSNLMPRWSRFNSMAQLVGNVADSCPQYQQKDRVPNNHENRRNSFMSRLTKLDSMPRVVVDGFFATPPSRFGCPEFPCELGVQRTVIVSCFPHDAVGIRASAKHDRVGPLLCDDVKVVTALKDLLERAARPSTVHEIVDMYEEGRTDGNRWVAEEEQRKKVEFQGAGEKSTIQDGVKQNTTSEMDAMTKTALAEC